MPDKINLTNLTDSADFVDLMSYGNEVTADMFGLLILLVIFISLFGATRSTGTRDTNALTVGSFGAAVSSILLYVIGIVGVHVVLLLIGLMMIPLVASFRKGT